MSTMLDILGSMVIGALVFLMILNFNMFTSQVKQTSDSELRLQGNAAAIAEMLEYDIRKTGFNYGGTSVITAQPKRFEYFADMDSNGTVERVTYFMGDSTEVTSTENPRDKILYCVINSDTLGKPALGLVDMKFTYRTEKGVITNVPANIKYIEVEIWVQAPYKVKNSNNENYSYPFTYWEMTIFPRNI